MGDGGTVGGDDLQMDRALMHPGRDGLHKGLILIGFYQRQEQCGAALLTMDDKGDVGGPGVIRPLGKKEGVAVGEEMSRSGNAAAVKENGNPSDGFLLTEQGSRVRLQGGDVGEVALGFLLIDGAAGGFP